MPNIAQIQSDRLQQQAVLSCGKFILQQVGELCCDPGFELEEHRQSGYELCYIVSGRATFFIDKAEWTAQANDLMVVRTGERHRMLSSDSKPVRYFYVSFTLNPEHPEYERYAPILDSFDRCHPPLTKDTLDIYNLYHRLFREINCGDDYVPEMLDCSLTQLLVTAYRDFQAAKASPPAGGSSDENIVYNIRYLIDTDILGIGSLANIGKSMGYSYSYLTHLFTQTTGQNIKSYYRQKFFEKAVELLKKNGGNITRVAEEMGYSTIHSFSRAFSKYYGVSPSRYIENNPQEDEGGTAGAGG